MSTIAMVLGAVLLAGILIGAYAFFAPARATAERANRESTALEATTGWTSDVGEEFAGLSEAARCDLIFEVAAFDDERSQQLLEHALNDPAEAVALAAAHALASSGRSSVLEAFLAQHPGARAQRLAQTLALLD